MRYSFDDLRVGDVRCTGVAHIFEAPYSGWVIDEIEVKFTVDENGDDAPRPSYDAIESALDAANGGKITESLNCHRANAH